MTTITNNFKKLITALRTIRDEQRTSNALAQENFFDAFYKDVVSYFSNPHRSIAHDKLAFDVITRDEPDYVYRSKHKTYTISRGRPSLRLHNTTIGANFQDLNTQVTGKDREVKMISRIDNTAPHAIFYFEDVSAHGPITPKRGQYLVFWYGYDLPWGNEPGSHRWQNTVDPHPGSTGKKRLLPLLYEPHKQTIEGRLHTFVSTISFEPLRKLFK